MVLLTNFESSSLCFLPLLKQTTKSVNYRFLVRFFLNIKGEGALKEKDLKHSISGGVRIQMDQGNCRGKEEPFLDFGDCLHTSLIKNEYINQLLSKISAC